MKVLSLYEVKTRTHTSGLNIDGYLRIVCPTPSLNFTQTHEPTYSHETTQEVLILFLYGSDRVTVVFLLL